MQNWYERLGLIIFDSIDSTQTEAHRLVSSRAKGNFIICARSQTNGRGRHGRSWISEEGGLYYSLLLQEDIDFIKGSELSFVIGNAVFDTIKPLLAANQDIVLKWPNDVLIHGHKIAGVLIEAKVKPVDLYMQELEESLPYDVTYVDEEAEKPRYYVVGIGMNLNSHPENIDQQTTSLWMAGGKKVSFEDVIDLLSQNIVFWLDLYKKLGFKQIVDSWLKKSFCIGRSMSTTYNGSKVVGIYRGVDPSTGALILTVEDKEMVITSGEIFLE